MRYILAIGIFLSCHGSIRSQTPCENGRAGEYPCQNVDLLSNIPLEGLQTVMANDIWGWTDPDSGKEYVIVGTYDGASFVDISDPVNPIFLGMLPDHSLAESASSKLLHDEKSSWRDVKVYQNHAYIVGEEEFQGVQVFDLTQLRDVTNPPVTFQETNHYDGVGNTHNIVINEDTGFAYAVGSTRNSDSRIGGLHILDLSDPVNPSFVSSYHESGYVHDAQCVIYSGPDMDYNGKEICFCCNETNLAIVDVDNKSEISLLSRSFYQTVAYTHQGWLTPDHKYFLMNDEGDELDIRNPSNTRTYIWNVEDLDNPYLIDIYTHRTPAIDHNLYVKGTTVYESNYTSGLRILDSERVQYGHLREKAYFDTYPSNDINDFQGSWSNYPYFETGVIAVSDISRGLFLVRENYQEAYVIRQPDNMNACYLESSSMGIEVGGGDLEYQWQLDDGTGFADIVGSDNSVYLGTNSDSLTLISADFDQNGLIFRCKVTPESGEEVFTASASFSVRDCTLDLGSMQNKVSIYPNPAQDFVRLSEQESAHFKVLTFSGKVVLSGDVSDEQAIIDISGLKQGLYLMQIRRANGYSNAVRFRKL